MATQAVKEFWDASGEALFTQLVIEEVLDVSSAWCERGRWAGYGPRFLKLGRMVRYRKADVLDWINQSPPVASTSENRELQMAARQGERILETGLDARCPQVGTVRRTTVPPVKRKRHRKAQPIEPAGA